MTSTRLFAAATAMAIMVTLTAGAAAGRTAEETPPGVNARAAERASSAPRIAWGRCTDGRLRRVGARCGLLSVPLDYGNPAGRKIQLAVSRVRHTTPRFQGAMLVNPGGPGSPGLDLAALGRFMPRRSGASYDWIGFDPRGVGASRPALSCRPGYFRGGRPPYVPRNQRDVQQWLARSRSYAQGCAKYGSLLDHMRTTDSARDMDQIRQALGVRRISFYGYSYGSYLGQVYATLFPSRVRRMVLDSNVDPTLVWYPSGAPQALALQRAMELFFAWTARHHSTYHLGRTAAAVERAYLRQRRALTRQPARGVLGPSEWDDAMSAAGYAEVVWPITAQVFAALANGGNPAPAIRLWRLVDDPGRDNTYAAFNAVMCTDAPTPDVGAVIRDARRLYRSAPILTWASVWNSAPCLYWLGEAGSPITIDGDGVRALLFGQTLDAPTPFGGSLEVRERFPRSRLVAITGGITHASTPDLAGTCARARLAAYLATGALPPRLPGRRADVACPAPPPPNP